MPGDVIRCVSLCQTIVFSMILGGFGYVYRRLLCCFLYLGFAWHLQLSVHVGLAAAVLQEPVLSIFLVSYLQEPEDEETNEPYTGPLLCKHCRFFL